MNDRDKLIGDIKKAVEQYERGETAKGVSKIAKLTNLLIQVQRKLEGLSNFDGEKAGSNEND